MFHFVLGIIRVSLCVDGYTCFICVEGYVFYFVLRVTCFTLC